jgi:hypothetical protein
MAALYPTTVTCQTIGRPGTGVHGVGLHTGDPATNGTVMVADPVPIARRLAVKLEPEDLLDVTVSAPSLEILGGPGQVPPDMSSPPVRTRVDPTVTHTAVAYAEGCHGASTVPAVHGVLVGVVVTWAAGAAVVDGRAGIAALAVVDDVEHPAMNRPAATARVSRQIATSTT